MLLLKGRKEVRIKRMKKTAKFIFIIMLMIPFIANASSPEEETFVKVAEEVKYIKTTSIINNSSVMRNADLEEMTSISTEVSKEEFDKAPTTSEPISSSTRALAEVGTETTYKRLTTTIEKSSTYYRYTTNLYWKNIPRVRSYDIIALGHYGDVEPYNSNTIMFNQEYCLTATSCYISGSSAERVTTYGTLEVFHLPENTLVSLEQTLAFTVKKAGNWTINVQKAAGDYSHATSAVTANLAANNATIGVGGLVLNENIYDYYDTTPAAIAVWNGTW